MKTIVVISDTHGHRAGIEKLKTLFAENDYIIHLGDGASDMRDIVNAYPEKTFVCQGNCDFFSALPEGELEVEGVKIFFCHGHKYRVKADLSALAEEAARRGCKAALYGHTHRALISEENGVLLVNPGSLRYPAGEGGSYCYLTVNGEKIYPVLVGESVF